MLVTAQIIQLRDYQQPKDLARMYSEQTLEQQAIEIMTIALMGDPVPVGSEPTIFIDTAPSEYTAPDQDSA